MNAIVWSNNINYYAVDSFYSNYVIVLLCRACSLVPRLLSLVQCTASDKSLGRPGYEARVHVHMYCRSYSIKSKMMQLQ